MQNVFREKVRRPAPTGLARRRLVDPIVSADGPGVWFVVAPAGAGKTTLLANVAAASASPTAWYLAGPEDGSESAFVTHLSGALSAILGEPVGPVTTIDDLLTRLDETETSTATHPIRLVIDDAHAITGSAAEAALARFLRLRPQWVRAVIGSRRPLGINTPRLLVADELGELDSDALRFRSWEVEDLFRTVYVEPLSPEAAAALTRHTGGWAAGLKLFHLATTGKSDAERTRAIAQLTGRAHLFRSYLTWNVLAELEPERREFLLATSTLGRLTGPLCDALLERTGSAGVLQDLERLQFFTVLADDGSYRYHQVLQTHLESRLVDELGEAAAAELHRRSAQLLEGGGHRREALRAYALADDWGSVARVLQQSSTEMTVDAALLARAALPDDDPWLLLVQARRLVRTGSISAAVEMFRSAERMADDAELQTRWAEERATASVWLPDPGLLGSRPTDRGPSRRQLAEAVRQATRRIQQPGLTQIPDDHHTALVSGITQLLGGHPKEARESLTRAAELAPVTSFTGIAAGLSLVLVEIASGDAAAQLPRLEELVLRAEVDDQPWLARLARGLLAAMLMVLQPAAWRAATCASLVAECSRDGDTWGETLLSLMAGTAHALVDDDDAARRWFAASDTRASELAAPVLGAWSAALESRLCRAACVTDGGSRAAGLPHVSRIGLDDVPALLDGLLPAPRRGGSPPPRRPALRLRCLGSFAIERDGEPLVLPPLRPLPRTLLLLLLLHHGRDVHREILIDAIWPDAPFEAATHRLHTAASTVRHCLAEAGLGDQAVVRSGDAYRLELRDAVLDVDELERLCRLAARTQRDGDDAAAARQWAAAMDCYTGDLLPEVGPAEWVLAERERRRLTSATAAATAAELQHRVRNDAEALRAARRAVELDPMRDSSWLLLAAVQEAAGDVTSAAMTRREHARVRAELDVELTPPPPPHPRPRPARRHAPDASRARA